MCELFLVKIDSGFDCLMSNMVVFSGFGLVGWFIGYDVLGYILSLVYVGAEWWC